MKFIIQRQRPISILMILIIVLNSIPFQLFALTGGPSQPEVESFKPIEVTDMVDPATGDFSYNIPLLEVGGYPINLIYNAGVTMDQEASMVGLGWNINPGVITRSVRGIPDDFKGDVIEKKAHMKDNITWGGTLSTSVELFGVKKKKNSNLQPTSTDSLLSISMGAKLGLNYNNYLGFGLEFSLTPSFTGGEKCMPGLSATMGLTADSRNGLGFTPNLSYSANIRSKAFDNTSLTGQIGTNINSRSGMKELTYSTSVSRKKIVDVIVDEESGSINIKEKSGSKTFSGSFNFSSTSYLPQIDLPMNNNSYTFTVAPGGEATGFFGSFGVTGYLTKQSIRDRVIFSKAYGIAYLEEGKSKNGLLDFNREKDGTFTKEKHYLPIPYLTHDVFSVSGQGIGGSYQLQRGDIGNIFDKEAKNISNGYSIGVEAGPGYIFRAGGDIHTNFTNSRSGKWDFKKDPVSQIFTDMESQPEVANQIGFEAKFFKAAGESSPFLENEENVFKNIGQFSAVKVELDKSGSEVKSTSNLKTMLGSTSTVASVVKRSKRLKRNQSVSYLTADEGEKFGIDKSVKSYSLNNDDTIYIGRKLHANSKTHHISEITAVRPDGLRYIYGIPAYNRVQNEVTFAVANNDSDCNTGLVTYDIHDGVVPVHELGTGISKDDYLDIESTPDFAHSFLLTAILSEDYVDKTGNGPSPDDLGTYTKFNYSRIHDRYRWRIPYEYANHNPGFRSQTNDDKGNFTYGEKEIWLIHSIESKTQIAQFIYSDRKDGHGVIGPHGGRDQTMSLKKLDKVILYSVPDFINNAVGNRTPIKSVHFEYDYSLCGSVPTNTEISENVTSFDDNGNQIVTNLNQNKGKLTLKKVYFKYGKSNKAMFSPYKFEYSSFNPNYHIKGYNRWGTYAPSSFNTYICNDLNKITSSDFCWIKQESMDSNNENEKNNADQNASAWNLKKIQLPSGGLINIDYEADDYSYVQDKQAMQLFEIIGANNIPSYSSTGNNSIHLYNTTPNNYLFFKLARPIPSGEDFRHHIYTYYLRQVITQGDLFFKVFIDLQNSGVNEYVQGYAEIEDWGATSSEIGYVKLKNVCTKDKDPYPSSGVCSGNSNVAHVISKTAWQFARLNLPHLVYGSENFGDSETDFVSVGNAFMNIWGSFKDMFLGGVNNKLLLEGHAKTIIKGKSWIRMSNPYGNKFAGTHRVKRILISDEWSGMTNNQHTTSQYGQEYTYTIENELNGKPIFQSSGVASFEPIIGSEDSPFKVPLQAYTQEVKCAPDNNHYIEGPLEESLFPSPNVIYSKVKVSNLQYTNVTKKATGFTIHEFYTAKDFPVKTEATTLSAYPKKTNPILRILKIKNQDFMTTSQGFAIELNDMHGKLKSKSVYNEVGTEISRISYEYKRDAFGLKSHVPLLMSDGNISQGVIGVDYNAVLDQREARNTTTGIGINLNNDNFAIGFIPIPSFVPLPFYSSEKTKYRSVVINKIVHRTGILVKTIAYDLGSTVETRNLAWDGITGEVLVTQTFNEFEDPIYNFNYPAHWVYRGMQNAYKNINAFYNNVSIGSGGIANVGSSHPFCEGDEVSLNSFDKAWVKSVTNTTVELIDYIGNAIPSSTKSIKIIRSGHRNKASTSIGSVVSLQNPISSGSLVLNGSKKVINASAIEFDDKRNVPCCESICPNKDIFSQGKPTKVIFNEFLQLVNFSQLNMNYQPCSNAMNSKLSQIFNPLLVNCNGGGPYSIAKEIVNLVGLGNVIRIKLKSNSGCECDIFSHLPYDTKFVSIVDYRTGFEIGAGLDISGNYVKCYNCAMGPIVTIEKKDGSILQNQNYFRSFCFNFYSDGGDCTPFEYTPVPSGNHIAASTNLYFTNQRGTYTPKKSYTFLADRKSSASSNTEPDLKSDGYFTNSVGNPFFDPFWKKTGNSWVKDPTDWTWTAEVTKIHPNGNELESRDPLNRYSSELLGYNDHMVTAVAGNARYGDCMFDGFEDYRYSIGIAPNSNSCPYKYFKFPEAEPVLDRSQCHSGKYYQSIQAGMATYAEYKLYDCKPSEGLQEGQITSVDSTDHSIPCDCLNEFNPKPGKYVFSAWIKEGNDPLQHDYQDSKCIVKIDNTINTFKASGPIIEGWQRVYGEFKIPNGASQIQIGLIASPTDTTGFDDIRIHPFDASFKSFVYDDITLRFTYELDENNYFTKYEYDDSGKLERVKKETERGVMTIQETRMSNVKKNN